MTRFAFTLSEKSRLPVMIRTTPRIAHTRGVVEAGAIDGRAEPLEFRRRPAELTPIPVNARRMRLELDQRFGQCESLLLDSPFFPRSGSGRSGVLCAGAPVPLVHDLVEELDLDGRLTIQSLGATHPAPRAILEEFLRGVLRGWDGAFADPDRAVASLLKFAPTLKREVELEKLRATQPLMARPDGRIGWMEAERWKAIQAILLETGVIDQGAEIDSVYTMEFLERIYSRAESGG